MSSANSLPMLKFGPFLVDLRSGELRKGGTRIRLQEKPLRVLALLADRPGELVSREELKKQLWPEDTFVDFEAGLNTAVKKLRGALSDDTDNPRYIETIPRRGYRFIAKLETLSDTPSTPPSLAVTVPKTEAAPQATPDLHPTLPVSTTTARELLLARTYPSKRPVHHLLRFAAIAISLLGIALTFTLVWRQVEQRRQSNAQAENAPRRIKIAILPFQNMTGDSEQEFISDGFTEEIITQLGQLDHNRLAVIARTSAMSYKNTQKSISDIAKELGVDYILEGSVRKTSAGLRVTAQLIRADDQTHIWAHEYDRPLEGLVQVQGEVAEAVAQEVQVKLTPESAAAIAAVRQLNADAYRSYLQGKYFLSQRTGDSLNKAVVAFQDSLDRDPKYAPAYAGLADAYNLLLFYGYPPGRPGVSKAKAAAQKAVEIDPDLGRGHASLAYVYFMWEWKFPEAEQEFKKALELDPNYSTAHHWYAQYLSSLGRKQEALAQIRLAEDLDPRSLIVTTAHGYLSYFAGNYDDAATQCQSVLQRNPNFMVAHAVLGLVEEQQHLGDKAILEFQKAIELSGGRPIPYLDYLGHAYASAGKTKEAIRILEELEEQQLKNGSGGPAFRAATLTALGRTREAMDALQEGTYNGDGALIWIAVDPRFQPLRSNPHFTDLVNLIQSPK